MKKLLGLTLGIMTALGGFVDLGQIVFTLQAGALFGYQLAWAVVLGTLVIILYMEMCGRIAVVAQEPVFAVVRDRLGYPLGLATLVASNLLNLLTCAAEIGGIAILLRLLTGWPERLLMVGVAVAYLALVLLLKFEWIERTFGLLGLLMILFAVSALALRPDWHQFADGLLPSLPAGDDRHQLLYAYFAVGIFSALLMEYEVHFYSSGAIEEEWKPADLPQNFAIAATGSLLGSLLTLALLALGALVFLPLGIFPETLSSGALAAGLPFQQTALVLGILGMIACLSGAAVETALSAGYNICQFFNLEWGKSRRSREVPVYAISWMGTLALAVLIVLSGVRPLQLVNISVVFGMVILPFTYYPILRMAADRGVMGKHANKRVINILGALALLLIVLAALAAIPLMVITDSGKP
jgi:Mn2+/Fe2+ NRAMP family transporter